MARNKESIGYIVNRWFAQFADLIDAICGILLLGFWYPALGMKVRAFYIRRRKHEKMDH